MGSAVVAGLLVAGALGACSGPSAADGFCDQVTVVQQAGPLFPARTDGEPVPNSTALAAIEGLADHRPEPIAEAIDVLIDEARSLSIQAQERLGQSAQVDPPNRRWSQSAVESAQSAVIAYAAEHCDIGLIPGNQAG